MQTLFPGSLPRPSPPSRFDRGFKAVSRVSLVLGVVLWPVFLVKHITSRVDDAATSIGAVSGVGGAQLGLAPSPVASFGVLPPRVLPLEDLEARVRLEEMAPRYEAMRSYSDVTEVLYSGEMSLMPPNMSAANENRKFRFCRDAKHALIEDATGARTFLGVQSEQQIRVRDPLSQGDGFQDTSGEFNASTLAGRLHLSSSGIRVVSGQGIGAFPAGCFVATFGADEKVGGTLCHAIKVADGAISPWGGESYRDYMVFIGAKDGLLHQLRRRQTRGNLVLERVETHSSIRVNPDLPASTWDFNARSRD